MRGQVSSFPATGQILLTCEMPQKRQLAAIMFTDLVGYTALMGEDSTKAMTIIEKSKEIQKLAVRRFGGKWLKEMGDGALVQFDTALDSVNCAIEIQKQARAELDARLRIGIHLGDVIVQDDDVFGDGVNVASRLESVADPGGIFVSDAVLKAITGQSDIVAVYRRQGCQRAIDGRRAFEFTSDWRPDVLHLSGDSRFVVGAVPDLKLEVVGVAQVET